MPASFPRIFLVRHSHTEWSTTGQHTGTTDIPLTSHGESTIRSLSPQVIPHLFTSKQFQTILLSPRLRAQQTFSLLFSPETPAPTTAVTVAGPSSAGSLTNNQSPPSSSSSSSPEGSSLQNALLPPYTIDSDVQEWNYGAYEGLVTSQIKALRSPSHEWDIWTQGCENGESAPEMEKRVDRVVEKVVRLHKEYLERVAEGKESEGDEGRGGDILIVSHGHFSRCFLTRWCKLPLTNGRIFATDPGAISILGYQHKNLEERSLLGVNLYATL